jgi:hypothetical protein
LNLAGITMAARRGQQFAVAAVRQGHHIADLQGSGVTSQGSANHS